MKSFSIKKTLAILIIISIILTSFNIQNKYVYAAPKIVKKVSIKIGTKNVTKKIFNMTKGSKKQLKVLVKPASAKKIITYQSKNKKIVKVSKKGKLKAKKVGTAKIIVKVKDKKGRNRKTWVKIKVSKKKVPRVTSTPETTYTPTATSTPETTYTPTTTSTPETTYTPTATSTPETTYTPTATSTPTATVAPSYTYPYTYPNYIPTTATPIPTTATPIPTLTPTLIPSVPTTYTVTFESNGGSVVASQMVETGKTVAKPIDPTKEGFIFGGWYSDETLNIKYEFTNLVFGNYILYAKWNILEDNLNDQTIDLGDIEVLREKGQIDVMYSENGNVITIDGKFTTKTVVSIDDAVKVLNSASSLFNTKGDAYDFNFVVDKSDITVQEINDSDLPNCTKEAFYRYNPKINGIPVFGSQIILTTKNNGEVSGLFSTYNDSIQNIDTDVDIEDIAAKNIVYDKIIGESEIQSYIDNGTISKSDFDRIFDTTVILLIYAADRTQKPALAYEVNICGLGGEAVDNNNGIVSFDRINRSYYIYANGSKAGEIFEIIDNNHEVQTELTSKDLSEQTRTYMTELEDGLYQLNDKSRKIETYKSNRTTKKKFILFGEDITSYDCPGTIVSANNSDSMDKAAVSVHANMAKVYDYYKNNLNRNSYDGNGKKIIITYGYHDFDSRNENAFWTNRKKQFIFQSATDGGNGVYVKCVDVMGHEYTHAVIDYVVGGWFKKGLKYQGETGALNESYADIMGSLIEGKNDTGLWLIGEDSNTIRDLSEPSKYGQPENYNQFDQNYKGDHGGVHLYSGIFNLAAYKMITDSNTNSISKEIWAKVFYNSLYRLSSDATFLDARGAIISAAKSYGFNEIQQEAIKKAFDDVGITEPNSIRIVLTWGAEPSDLDSHLTGPGIGLFSNRFHIYYSQRNYYVNGTYDSETKEYAADLDYDDTTSFGPEITTIHKLTPGDYYFYVHDYTNGSSDSSTKMANSGAEVKIYYNDSHTLQQTYKIGRDSSGTYWNVFKLTIDDDKNIAISPINTYGTEKSYD